MKGFDAFAGVIKSGGKTRRAAKMVILNAEHPDVLEFIASNITNNIRELEGALIRVAAYASLNREPLSAELAERVLADSLRDKGPRIITPDLILEMTCTRFAFSLEEIKGKSRRRPLVGARQVAMYVMRMLTDLSYPAIAREFGITADAPRLR